MPLLKVIQPYSKDRYICLTPVSKIRKHIKEELKEEFGDLVYEKAKEEVKERFWSRYYTITDKIFAFFGFTAHKRKEIEKISEELKAENQLTSSDTVLGMMELFTLHYANSAVELMTTMLGADAESEMTKDIELFNEEHTPTAPTDKDSLNIDDA
jgi:hypothetical protein